MKQKKGKGLIILFSILIPVVVAVLLLGGFQKEAYSTSPFWFLPHFNGFLNLSVTLLLLGAWRAIRSGKRELHQKLMFWALGLSVIFLLSYVLYHATVQETRFPVSHPLRYVYYFILLTHILFSLPTVPLVLSALYYAYIAGDFAKHRRVVRWAFPVWLYVAITGVLVYILIAPYYG